MLGELRSELVGRVRDQNPSSVRSLCLLEEVTGEVEVGVGTLLDVARPEVSTAMLTAIPGAGNALTAAKGVLGAATRGIGAEVPELGIAKSGYIPKLALVASYSTPTSLAMTPLSGKDPLKK
jgi:hypothetical protein